MENKEIKPRNFIQEIIDKDIETGKYNYVYTDSIIFAFILIIVLFRC